MEAAINENPTNEVVPNIVRISRHFYEVVNSQTDKHEWHSLFNEFRLNLQSRIVGSDERGLLKQQAKLEFTNELEKFFLSIIETNKPDQ